MATDAQKTRGRELEHAYTRIEKRTLPPTFSKATKDWLDKNQCAASTRDRYTYALAHLRKAFGSMLVCDISADDIRRYQETRQAGPATVNKECAVLCAILRSCNVWDAIKKDVNLLREPVSKGRALSPTQERDLLAAAAQSGNGKHHQGRWSPVYTVTVIALNTGMRHCEIRSLRWSQVDLQGRMLIVGESKTQNGTGRPIPLAQPAWAAFDMWAARFPNRRPEYFVFPACENGKVDPTKPICNWRTAWNNACEAAGLPGLGFHSLRHSAVTKLLENGVPFAVVAQIAGWAPSTAMRMAKHYRHIRHEAQRAALEKIATTAEVFGGGYKIGYNQHGVAAPPQRNCLIRKAWGRSSVG